MPRRKSADDPFQRALNEFTRQIAQQLAEGLGAGLEAALAEAGIRGGKPRSAARDGKPCAVPGCNRRAAARGLCQNHYAKAKRLRLDVARLGATELETLAKDLRGAG